MKIEGACHSVISVCPFKYLLMWSYIIFLSCSPNRGIISLRHINVHGPGIWHPPISSSNIYFVFVLFLPTMHIGTYHLSGTQYPNHVHGLAFAAIFVFCIWDGKCSVSDVVSEKQGIHGDVAHANSIIHAWMLCSLINCLTQNRIFTFCLTTLWFWILSIKNPTKQTCMTF